MTTEFITKEYLKEHPNHIFVFGDNLLRKGYAGAAALRDEPNTFGFITKKYPTNDDEAFFHPEEYVYIFFSEFYNLKRNIEMLPDKLFLISKIGDGLANKYHIFENVIQPQLKTLLMGYKNVKFLW